MAHLNRDDWPLSDKPTNKKGSSASNTTQTQGTLTQRDISSAKKKPDTTSTSKKSGKMMAEDAKESSPSHKETGIRGDASRATSQPRDKDPSDHQLSSPPSKPKPKSGNDISSRAGVQRNPKVPHDYDDRKNYYHMPDKAGRLEEEIMDQALPSKKERRRG